MSGTVEIPRRGTAAPPPDGAVDPRSGHGDGAALRARDGGAAGPGRRRIALEQLLVAGGQLAAGLGNLAFALLAARLLEPRGFAQLAAFLALYLLVHVPASSLSAGSALTPALAARARRRVLLAGGALGAALAVAASPLSGPAGVPAALLFVLAAGIPAAGWLALERGRLYGAGLHRRVAASLVAEPLVRLAVGVPLVLGAGVAGGAAAVVLGGFAAIAMTRPEWRRGAAPAAPAAAAPPTAAAPPGTRASAFAMLAFLALAVVQNQDVVLANGLLGDGEAGRFAVLSTLGGAAAFATTTVPLVLLPRAARGERHALTAAVGAAVLLGGAAVGAVALVPGELVATAFGDRYAGVAPLAVPYVAAMALFGVARVLVAHRCATGGGAGPAAAVAAVAAAQAAAILLAGDDAATVAWITLGTTGALALVAAGATVAPRLRRARPAAAAAALPRHDGRTLLAIAGIAVVALVLRLLITRGIWLDEATSITQAQMGLHELIERLRTTDVHPPLHHLVLWAIFHATGSTSELAMRLPSVIAGTALVPVLYLLGRELYDRRAATMAAALATVAPFALWYSQEARMYALFMLFAALAMLGQVQALRHGRARDWLLWAVATVLLIWTQYFGLLFTAVQVAGFALAARSLHRAGRPMRGYLAGWIGASLLVAVALAPLAGFALDQFEANQAAGRGFDAPKQAGDVDATRNEPGVYVALTNLVWAVLGYHAAGVMAAITSLWPLGILAALLALGRRPRPLTLFVLACALLPGVALAVLGVAKPFLFEVRYFAGAVPLLLLVIARAATGWARGAAATTLVTVVLVGGFAVASADQQLNGSNPRVYDFEGALSSVEERRRPGDLVAYEPQYLRDVVGYYSPDLRTRPLRDGIPRDARRVFVLGSFLEQPRHREAISDGLSELERRGYRRTGVEKRPQIRMWIYERPDRRRPR